MKNDKSLSVVGPKFSHQCPLCIKGDVDHATSVAFAQAQNDKSGRWYTVYQYGKALVKYGYGWNKKH